MKVLLPAVRGTIERRLLVNFRGPPELLRPLLPQPFRVKTIRGFGMAGICLIRLRDMRVRFAPAALGVDSENAAHRIAVEWDQKGKVREGVFIPRRDTSSALQTWIGGSLFPGVHHRAEFCVREGDGRFFVEMTSRDGSAHVVVDAERAEQLPAGSLFRNLAEASEFFRAGSLGYSVTAQQGEFDGLELNSLRWELKPLAVNCVESGFFSNREWFPPGAVRFDSAFLMENIEHEWLARGALRAGSSFT